jgi:ubiquinone/menaquinone biosynthesis C-methylase UbiE
LEKTKLFDEWPNTYDSWFTTPIGALVKRFEAELLIDLLRPCRREVILDAGCGTGVFTFDLLSFGTSIIGIDISLPMLMRAREKARAYHLHLSLGDISSLPFRENSFDKVVSVTALEFIKDAEGAVRELFRVTQKGGSIIVATLNSLSPWATRRRAEAQKGHPLFQKAIFRSPDELRSLLPLESVIKTAIHFQKNDNPDRAVKLELEGQRRGLKTGAFVAVRWEKP